MMKIVLFIVVIFALIAVPSVSAVPCNCGDICVNETGWWCDGGAFNASGTPIQGAIDNATAGDTICVKDGAYNENVDVNRRLTVRSENGSANCIVNASNPNDHVFNVTADYVNLSGLTVQNATGEAGIYLGNNVDHCNISDNTASNNRLGIYLVFSNNNTIRNVTVKNNFWYGIYLDHSDYTNITDSNASSNVLVGILLSRSNYTTITGCNASSNNWYGIWLTGHSFFNTIAHNEISHNVAYAGICLRASPNNNINNNTLNSATSQWGFKFSDVESYDNDVKDNTINGYYYYHFYGEIGTKDNPIIIENLDAQGHKSSNIGNVFVGNSENVTLRNITVKNNEEMGLYIYSGKNIIAKNISASNNGAGIRLDSTNYTSISNCNTSANDGDGIHLESSNYNNISNCNTSSNSDGIELDDSSYNNIINCNASLNSEGICLDNSNYNYITNCIASFSTYCEGIYLDNSNYNNITDCTASSNDEEGIYFGSSNHNYITDCTASSNGNNPGIEFDDSDYNSITNCTASSNGGDGIEIYYSDYNNITNCNASSNWYGIELDNSNYNSITNCTAFSNDRNGVNIYLSNYNNITNCTASLNGWEGIAIIYSDHNNIINCNAYSNGGEGIDLFNSDYNNITNCNAFSNGEAGIYLYDSDDYYITNCNASSNIWGIYLEYSWDNNITNCTASSNDDYDFYSTKDSQGNIVKNLTIASYPTTISFTYDEGIGLKGVESPPPDPAEKGNIGKYVNATKVTADSWIFLNVSYTDADLGGVDEATLKMYRHNGTGWELADGSGINGVNHAANYVYAKITSFSVFAPLGNVPVANPDLVITEKWVCWPDNCTICYNVTNIGTGTAPACHNTTLYVDGMEVAHDHVPVDLAPGESYIGCFDPYIWTYMPPSDNITVCADNNETIDELDETNNCLTDIWTCGDVNDDGKVTMSDVRKVFSRYLNPNYPLDLPWAADVNCDGKVSMSDVRKVFNRYLDPGYELECCCEGVR